MTKYREFTGLRLYRVGSQRDHFVAARTLKEAETLRAREIAARFDGDVLAQCIVSLPVRVARGDDPRKEKSWC